MKDKLTPTTLGKVLNIKHGYPFLGECFSDEGEYVILTPGNFYEEGGFKRVFGKEKYYLGDFPNEYLCSKGDLIVAMTQQAEGLLGSTAVIPESGVYLHNQRIGLIEHDVKQTDKYFLYYLFMTTGVRKQIRATASGSKVKHTSPERIYDVKVWLPDLPQQKAIASILSSIDRKIALNNAINAELEKTAKLLYDYWFVQFDFPDVEGNPYRTSGGEMEYNEQLKRDIPNGWKTHSLFDVVDNITESTISGAHLRDMYYSPLDVIPMRRMCFFGGQSYQDAKSSLLLYKENDILLGAMRVHFHRVCLSTQDGITRSTTIVLRPKNTIELPFVYQLINSDETIAYAVKLSAKSQQPYVNWENELERFCFAMPNNNELILKYSSEVSPFITMIKNNERENYELAALRDFLLPLLMNGQVTVTKTATANIKAEEDAPAESDAQAKRAAVFKRLVLSAYILDNICDEPTAGRVKFEKLLYLSEHCAQLPLHSEFQRAAAGPYDPRALHSIENGLQKNKWFKRQKVTGESRAYKRMSKAESYKSYVSNNLNTQQKSMVDKLISLLKSARTIQCEIIATLYGAWNDYLIDATQPNDEQIINEVLTNWHESKERIDRERWIAALNWMRENDIVPTGYGVPTKNTVGGSND